ncbi:helix-turn-helix domain-containing protein [Acidisoma sp. C75]
MDYLAQVRSGIDYIEANLDEEIALAAVARAASLSQWHFQRIFKALTNETVKTYIRSRRLAVSLDKLRATNERILDIAIAAGYESQEAFSRAFKASFGMTPTDYRRIKDRSLFPGKVMIDEAYLRHIHRNLSLDPTFIRLDDMSFVGLSTRFYGIDSDKNNIGDHLPALWAAFMPRVREIPGRLGAELYGIVRPLREDGDELEYFAAAAVGRVENLPEGMARMTVPGATYARFAHRGLPQAVDLTVNYIYSNWLLGSGKRHTGGPDIEIYGPGYLANSADSVFHYAIPVA